MKILILHQSLHTLFLHNPMGFNLILVMINVFVILILWIIVAILFMKYSVINHQ